MMKALNDLIREAAADMPDADPREIAAEVARKTTRDVVYAFYADSLIGSVRSLLRNERNSAMSGASRSPKVEQRREWFARLLATRIHVGESNWLTLGMCGRDELKFAISERETQIVRTRAQVENLTALLSLLDAHGVTTVGDLPIEELPEGAEL